MSTTIFVIDRDGLPRVARAVATGRDGDEDQAISIRWTQSGSIIGTPRLRRPGPSSVRLICPEDREPFLGDSPRRCPRDRNGWPKERSRGMGSPADHGQHSWGAAGKSRQRNPEPFPRRRRSPTPFNLWNERPLWKR